MLTNHTNLYSYISEIFYILMIQNTGGLWKLLIKAQIGNSFDQLAFMLIATAMAIIIGNNHWQYSLARIIGNNHLKLLFNAYNHHCFSLHTKVALRDNQRVRVANYGQPGKMVVCVPPFANSV